MKTPTDSIIGRHAGCNGTVVFIDNGIEGWRFCLGCLNRGPCVALVDEIDLGDDDPTLMVLEDDLTAVGEAPADVMERARR